MNNVEYLKTPIRPWNCVEEAWRLVKDQYWLFFGIVLVGALIGGAVPVVLIGPMMCGIYLCYLKKMRGEPVMFEMLFKGFDWFVPSLIAALILSVIIGVLVVPMYLIFMFMMFGMAGSVGTGEMPFDPAMIGVLFPVMIVLYMLMILLSMLFIFVFQLIVDKKCTATQAISLSTKAVVRNFWGIFGLMLVNVLLSLAGMLCCFVGAYLILPISYGSFMIAYRRIFPEGEPLPAEA